MKLGLGLVTLLACACFGAEPEKVPALVERIARLVEQEPLESGIDTRLRAAQLLMPTEPGLGGRFLSTGMDLLRAHPEVPRHRTITSAMVALDVPDGDKVLLAGNDRVLAINQLLWHWSERGHERRGAVLLRDTLRDPQLAAQLDKLWGVRRILKPLAE